MAYWGSILRRALKRATDLLRLNPPALFALILTQGITAWIGFSVGGKAEVNLSQRIAAIAAPFVLLPGYLGWAFFSTIGQKNKEQETEINALRDRNAELEAEGDSDISMYLDLNHAVHIHPDHEPMHSYSVVIENTAPSYLTNCILKLSTANSMNLALHDRSWLHDASETFDLRPGQVKTLYILWTEAYDPRAPAYPQYYRPDEPDVWPGTGGGEIIPADQTYFLFCEVLSANTIPARLTLRVWNDGEGWQLEALATGERPSFDA